MQIREHVSLAAYSTMGLGGQATYLCDVTTRDELIEAITWAHDKQVPVIMIGGGSNIIWSDAGFPGLVIVNKLLGYDVIQEDETGIYLKIAAGENWDSVVERTVRAGLTGIEALSLIPGSTGATPVQNVGAYGQEIAQSLTTVEAFDTKSGEFETLSASDCDFGYRTSRFKTTDRGRFYICSITLHLRKADPKPPFYGQVQTYFTDHDITHYSPQALRNAVVHIRTNKLPDPALIRNTGSFFANPVVTSAAYQTLAARFDPIPHWEVSENQIKVSAAWLIEQAGFKDYHDADTGMATWPKQPLVLINESAQSTADLLRFKQKIIETVQAQFGITLIQEPELL